jgi:prepilin-type processing-associated H-X9-DG protein
METSHPWTGTNYLANWNTLCAPEPAAAGYAAIPQTFNSVTDGLSNTILLGEAYAWCEGRGRTAFLAWHGQSNAFTAANSTGYGTHNFGLTYTLSPTTNQIVTGNGTPVAGQTNGVPNPVIASDLNFFFQIRPSPILSGVNGCDSNTVQTGHSALNVAMADGSVRSFDGSTDPNVWALLMLPNDGQAVNLDE